MSELHNFAELRVNARGMQLALQRFARDWHRLYVVLHRNARRRKPGWRKPVRPPRPTHHYPHRRHR